MAQQHVAEPAVNLGDTSFLDGVAGPGWLIEEIADGGHYGTVVNGSGTPLPGSVNEISGQTHVAWFSNKRFAGGWYGVEVLDEAVDVDAGARGHASGAGALIFAPLILEWTQHRFLGMPVEQRLCADFLFPASPYSRYQNVNVGSDTYAANPYYSVTIHPAKRIESSWRMHYLWNSVNNAPPISTGYRSTQAGQALHFNATAAYNIYKGLWIGTNSYYLSQITDGRIDGVATPNSPERVAAIGPGVFVTGKHIAFFANEYHEFAAQNRATGSKLVLRVSRTF